MVGGLDLVKLGAPGWHRGELQARTCYNWPGCRHGAATCVAVDLTGGTDLGPLGHTAVSVGIGGGVWATTGSAMAIPAAAATGVLVDADHILDFYYWFAKKDTRRLFLLFHAWEYVAIGLVLIVGVWNDPVFVAAVLGLLGHLLGDQIGNRPTDPMTYSIAYRASKRFRGDRMFERVPTTLSETLHSNIPLWRFIEPRLLNVAASFRKRAD